MDTLTNLTDALNARQNEYRYLVLDPLKKVASWDPLHADMLRNSHGSDALRRILRPDLAWSPEHCPILLLLASPGGSLDEDLVRSSETYAFGEALYEKRYVCGWLNSALSPDEMAVWLADLCKHIKPGVSIPAFEPLRLELLQATADPELLAGLLAATSQWHWMSCTGELRTLSGRSGDDVWMLNRHKLKPVISGACCLPGMNPVTSYLQRLSALLLTHGLLPGMRGCITSATGCAWRSMP